MKELDRYNSGELISRLESDISILITYDIEFITTIAFILLNFLIPIIIIFGISLQLSLITLIFLPLNILIYVCFAGKKKRLSEKMKKFDDTYFSYIGNIFQNIKSIKCYKIEQYIISKYNDLLKYSFLLQKKNITLSNIVDLCNELLGYLFGVMIIIVSTELIYKGHLTIGLLVSFNIYINKLFESIGSMQRIKLNEKEVAVAITRIEQIMDSNQENIYSSYLLNTSIFNICVNSISFQYDNNIVLRNIKFEMNHYGLYTIVGENGCGKTTLLNILMKLYDYYKGDIIFNNISLHQLTEGDVRSKITYISKEPFILIDSIYNNLCLGKTISKIDVINACKRVGLYDYIENLPSGIDTILNETGVSFSSGMKQKLSIARTLLQTSEIIIFDEITSDLDGESEKNIIDIIKELSREHIILMVTHKVRTVIVSDLVFVLRNGEIVSIGQYNDLIKQDEYFQRLFL